MEQLKGYQFKDIRKLTVSVSNEDKKFILQGLFYCFPHVEHLIYLSSIDSIILLTNVIDGFVHLLNASFHSYNLRSKMKSMLYSSSDVIIQNSQRLNENNFTHRVQKPMLFSIHAHWWIAPQVSLYYQVKILFIYIFLYNTVVPIIFSGSVVIRIKICFASNEKCR
jgi:hypothetical protein